MSVLRDAKKMLLTALNGAGHASRSEAAAAAAVGAAVPGRRGQGALATIPVEGGNPGKAEGNPPNPPDSGGAGA
ncbi:hypothetical protein CDV50_00635 [Haematobacter massiliensis]|uniref:Uncharacterized protein n=1 Tax=Haematobacter massiliensis TaxID=195105 RepID=A0A086Y3A6_9RHOB|nr:hypothetical protein [Haematobacter massiliensis]KFI28756.1 hypothetical protein CN97_18585 [Haematobacter massiliensis]OWJ73993.1 hypothetical protein CDV50_00635 [Haematobacter massiliensis]OWJ85249.1 hypothetical protein CDV51_12490 [Haematobacter massiliensis]QBJ26064.1 hypothetical protein HmaOT1_17090 [Haematobacter massiliensis]